MRFNFDKILNNCKDLNHFRDIFAASRNNKKETRQQNI